jgi:YfiH family protein
VGTKLYSQQFSQGVFEVYAEKPEAPLIHVHQTHSDIILTSQGEDLSEHEADGIRIQYDDLSSKWLAIKTADCMPIVFLGNREVVFIHAGWRGVQQRIHLSEQIKQIAPHTCLIGPSICAQSFEVQEDFKTHFPETRYYQQIQGKLYFDLHQIVVDELTDNFPQLKILDNAPCTLKDHQFHSYRRDKTTQRNWNIFRIKL